MFITDKKILKINELYAKYNSIETVAEILGIKKIQVLRYIIKNQPENNIDIKLNDLPEFRAEDFIDKDLQDLCNFSESEYKDILFFMEKNNE